MKIRRIITVIMLISTLTFMITPIVKATINPDDYKPNNPSAGDVTGIVNIANPIIGTLKVIGIVVAVITLAVLGIKYMTGSVSEKAEYKKTMIPYLIGAILVVAITQILGVIIEVVIKVK